MCLEVLKNPVQAIAAAKKTKNRKHTILTTIAGSVLFGIATLLMAFHTQTAAAGNFLLPFEIGLGFTFLMVIFMLIGALFLSTATKILGGKGSVYEGLTVFSFSMLPIAVGAVVLAISTFLLIFTVLGALIFTLLFVVGIATLYRGVKELYSVDMVTAMVSISILLLSLFIFLYALVLAVSISGGMPIASLGGAA